jgi:cbb3-type cytochrome oxidase subunit 3
MKSLGMKFFTDVDLTALGLLLFFCVFVGAIFWVHRKGSEKFYGKISRLPFEEDVKNG